MPQRRLLVASLAVISLFFARAAAQSPECVSVKGALLANKGEAAWTPVHAGEKMTYDRLLVSLFDSVLRSADGAVEIKMRGEIGEIGPLPAFESAITLHENSKVDLDVTVDRGIVVFTNLKKDGPARIDLKLRGKTLAVTLREPQTKLGVNLYARHAPGMNAVESDNPTTFVFMLNAKGAAQIHCDGKEIGLKAPPGPAWLRWDSHSNDCHIEHLDKVPDWVTPTPEEAKTDERINELAKALAQGNSAEALIKMLESNDAIERKVAATSLGALGKPAPLFAALRQSKHADTRQFMILVIRNWLGQGPGQIKKLEAACEAHGLSKPATESLVHLLLGFDEEEQRLPATYQALIEGLGHSRLLVRELSYWHLRRLAPAGLKIAYDPAGSPEQIQAAVRQWRELIPAGQLPPAEKK